jgi:hypothetical protein
LQKPGTSLQTTRRGLLQTHSLDHSLESTLSWHSKTRSKLCSLGSSQLLFDVVCDLPCVKLKRDVSKNPSIPLLPKDSRLLAIKITNLSKLPLSFGSKLDLDSAHQTSGVLSSRGVAVGMARWPPPPNTGARSILHMALCENVLLVILFLQACETHRRGYPADHV